jgi:hypothetical protein
VIREIQAQQEPLVLKALLALTALPVQQVPKAHKVFKVLQVPQEPLALKVLRVTLEPLVLKVSKA